MTMASAVLKAYQAYERTHARMKGDPDYERLKAAAEAETDGWLARNRYALFIEFHTPLFEETPWH